VHDSLQSTLTILGAQATDEADGSGEAVRCVAVDNPHSRAALSQVWTNLIDNAVDASPQGARLEIVTWSEPGWLVVSIADQGTGIPAEVLPHIFEAFFTTKPQGSGTGLGLEIVHRIVTQKFGGTIEVESEPGNTRFIVRLPLEEADGQFRRLLTTS